MPPLSDPQRDGIYEIEAEFSGLWKHARTPREHLEGVVTAVTKYYGFPLSHRPTLRIVRHIRGGHAGQSGEGEVELSREDHGVNTMVLLHELAHWLIEEFYEDVEDHGPEFAAILMHLYDKWGVIPQEWYRIAAKKNRVTLGRRFRPRAFR